MNERETIDRGWYYVVEPDGGRWVPQNTGIESGDGTILSRRLHGTPARIDVVGEGLGVATLLRAAAAVGRVLEAKGESGFVRLDLSHDGPPKAGATDRLHISLDGQWTASQPSHHQVEAEVAVALAEAAPPALAPPVVDGLPVRPTRRLLAFESLMNTDMPHNDREISQGVLHFISPLKGEQTEVVLANVKMSITGDDRPVLGMERLRQAVRDGGIGLVCITLLEGYFEGVCKLIEVIRSLGCDAHIAVGGVMPTLAPEHVAAHLPEVSFVCRGAGEVFVPQLVRIVGNRPVHEGFTDAQRDALLRLNGVLAVERRGGAVTGLISANSAAVVQVEDLSRVDLDLAHLQARHIEGGIEIATSRGCIHKCTFCSIIGRESYQARSTGSVFDLLATYERRFKELHGDHIPHNAYRVHISDDDFACDRDRTVTFFRHLLHTPFRLSSAQVAIGDLCRKANGRLLLEPDHELLDAIQPECFADHGRPLSREDFVSDHKSRNWSSYLQIGVESYDDSELIRLGKGYRRAHVRMIVAELARRRLHMDGYFILSNAETTAENMVAVFLEVARLKLRFHEFFHMRFPLVPHLVSYFTSASFRRHVRRGRTHVLALRDNATIENHPEFDYPFVDHDIPQDPWVSAAVDADFVTDTDLYTANLPALRSLWLQRLETLDPDSEEYGRGERLIRSLDDQPRRLTFEMLRQAWLRREEDWPGLAMHKDAALKIAEEVLGPNEQWIRAFRNYTYDTVRRLVIIPTWQCELRCSYCWIPKQDGRVMSLRTAKRSIDLLMSTEAKKLMLQFFGGEALLEFDLMREVVDYANAGAKRAGKEIEYLISTNGWSINEEKLAWMTQHPIKLELSLDGDRYTQETYRAAGPAMEGQSSYTNSIARTAKEILESGVPNYVIMVVHNTHVDAMPANFFHIADMGFKRIQINNILGRLWTKEQSESFAKGLFKIGAELRTRWAKGDPVNCVNLERAPAPMRLNGEVTIDWDGTVFGGNGFLHETEHKDKFAIGHLDDLTSMDRHWIDLTVNDFLLQWSYQPHVTENNLAVGRIMVSFVRWMQKQGIGPNAVEVGKSKQAANHS